MGTGESVVRIGVAGKVQGVGYREWTRRQATALGLAGWVRNRRDGTVEALLYGAAEAVEAMVERCRAGPPSARVTGVERLAWDGPRPAAGFEVRETV